MKILITGASRGIGRGISRSFAREGWGIGLLARSADLLEETCGEAVALGAGACCSAPCDLRSLESTETAIATCIEALGGVDVLVNNAGLVIRKEVRSIDPEEWIAMMETNVNGPFYATRAVLPHFEAQGSGHIINISSISGRLPLPGGSGYAASKYALTGFSESLFHEVRDLGVKVTTVFPGSVDSASHRHDAGDDSSWKVSPDEVGDACRDLLKTSPGNCISRLEIRPLRKPN